jgi:hypothetical protein
VFKIEDTVPAKEV